MASVPAAFSEAPETHEPASAWCLPPPWCTQLLATVDCILIIHKSRKQSVAYKQLQLHSMRP